MRGLILISTLLLVNFSSAQKYFTDISVTSGGRFNQYVYPERIAEFENENRYERSKYHSRIIGWNPFFAVQTTIFHYRLKNQKKGRSLSLKLEGGLFFHKVMRDHYYDFLFSKKIGSDSMVYHINGSEEHLAYTTKSNNLGISLNVIFVKKWSEVFDFEYGLVYKSDFSFLQDISYENQPEDDSWRELEYSKSHYLKNRFSQEVYLYLGTMFNLNKKLSLGLTVELPTLIYGYYSTRNSYPIVGTENNFNNKNVFFGLKCAYKWK